MGGTSTRSPVLGLRPRRGSRRRRRKLPKPRSSTFSPFARAVRRTPAADGGRTVRRRPTRTTRHGLRGLPVDQLLQLLAGLEVGDALGRHVHSVARSGVAAAARLAAPETETAEAAEFDLLPLSQRLRDVAEHGADNNFGALLREAGGIGHLLNERRLRKAAFGHGLVFRRKRQARASPPGDTFVRSDDSSGKTPAGRRAPPATRGRGLSRCGDQPSAHREDGAGAPPSALPRAGLRRAAVGVRRGTQIPLARAPLYAQGVGWL